MVWNEFKVNNRNARTKCQICSKLTIKTPEPRQWRRSGVFIVNFEYIWHVVLVFILLNLSRQIPVGLHSPGLLLKFVELSLVDLKMWHQSKSRDPIKVLSSAPALVVSVE